MKKFAALASLALGLSVASTADAQTQAQTDTLNAVGDGVCAGAWFYAPTGTWRCQDDSLRLHIGVAEDGQITRWWRNTFFLPGTMAQSIDDAFPGAEVASIRRTEGLAGGPGYGARFDAPSTVQYTVTIAHEGAGYNLLMTAHGEIGDVTLRNNAPNISTMPALDFPETPDAVDEAFAQIGEHCPNVEWRPCTNGRAFTAICDTDDRLAVRFFEDGTIRHVRTDAYEIPMPSRDTVADIFSDYEVRRMVRIESRWSEEPLRYRTALRGNGQYRSAVLSPLGDLLRAARLVEFSDVPAAVMATLAPNEAGTFHRAWAIELPDGVRYRFVYHTGTEQEPARRAVVIEEDGTLIRVRDWTPPC